MTVAPSGTGDASAPADRAHTRLTPHPGGIPSDTRPPSRSVTAASSLSWGPGTLERPRRNGLAAA
ncbi:hypothetical protein OOK36_27865 [Streptomyces sp. NBC_00365]|uniref:hypothetical protein n=1 Tax=Streptomyces sp. NBC_00365 TaxID=2975726 RepID=UPI002253606F|nr:hypothetical protein [Streptomyces sp. NBC_00365]MCX5092630.1 hypothetical protein [Streptomyces sp. NBC_00365]